MFGQLKGHESLLGDATIGFLGHSCPLLQRQAREAAQGIRVDSIRLTCFALRQSKHIIYILLLVTRGMHIFKVDFAGGEACGRADVQLCAGKAGDLVVVMNVCGVLLIGT